MKSNRYLAFGALAALACIILTVTFFWVDGSSSNPPTTTAASNATPPPTTAERESDVAPLPSSSPSATAPASAPAATATDEEPQPPRALSAPLAAVLAGLPDVPLRTQIKALPVTAQRRALRKLERLTIPAEDFNSLRVTADGSIYYSNDAPPPSPAAIVRLSQSSGTSPEPTRQLTGAAAVPIASPPVYHSRPGSTNVLYLDFSGHTVTGTSWNSGTGAAATYVGVPYDIDDDPTTFSDAEQADIFAIWERVAEDYAPFDIDVTTEEPATFTSTTGRVLITRSTDANDVNMPSSNAGGVAQLDVFGDSDYVTRSSPAFVYYDNFYGSAPNIAEAASHEFGHNLGLTHDGQPGVEYYGGHGSGATSWGPIMGTGYGRNVSQFTKGDYFNANNPQDDFVQITSHIAYATDEAGSTTGTAAAAPVTDSAIALTGVISSASDLDVFAVTTAAGDISFAVDAITAASGTRGANLDLKLELLDSSGQVVASHAPNGALDAALTYSATAGDYFIRISGDGDGSPLSDPPTGYTAYGSAGQYTLTGTIVAAAPGITSETTASVDAGALFAYTIVATNSPSSYNATGLPAGLSINASTGVIGGRPTETGTFSVSLSATNSLGTGTGSLTLTVNDAAPAITTQSTARQLFTPGSDQTLSVTPLSANGTATYQWEHNGFDLTGATSATLDLTSVTGATSGYYRVRVTNTIGTTVSDPIFVHVMPEFTRVVTWGADGQGVTSVPSELDDAVQLSLGYEFAAAVRRDGTLIAWGSDSSGQATAPTSVTTAVAVDTGNFHAVALQADGTVVAWGNDFYDQASPPSGLTDVLAVAAGGDFSLALKADGTVVAWGRNHYGQTDVPAELNDVVAIAAGDFHGLALKSDGSLVGWGRNTDTQITIPTAATSDVVAIDAGYAYSLALKSDGSIVAWGNEDFGQLTLPNELAPFVTFAAGDYHGVALDDQGALAIWGYNGDGQRVEPLDLGPALDVAAGRFNTGVLQDGTVGLAPEITDQSPLRQTFATGDQIDLAVTVTGYGARSYQWYQNSRPIIGATSSSLTLNDAQFSAAGVYWVAVTDDYGTSRSRPMHVLFAPPRSQVVLWGSAVEGSSSLGTPPSDLVDAIDIAAGPTHIVALKADGTVVAWGSNNSGETTVPSSLSDVVSVAAGYHVSYALKSDGTVVAWGANDYGEGSPPTGLTDVIELDIEYLHVVALRADSSVVAWGNTGSGQTDVPVSLSPATAVAASAFASYALHADGSVSAWGNEGNGELNVPTGVTVTAVAGGYYHNIALLADGSATGWGFSALNNLPSGLDNLVEISASVHLSLALRADRTVTAWGFADANAGRTPPTGLNDVFGISAGDRYGAALQQVPLPTVPEITTQPADLTVDTGESATFTVVASGYPEPTYRWYRDGVVLTGETNATLQLEGVTRSDTADYLVEVTNSEGTVISTAATLTVNYAPEITSQPASVSAVVGAGATLSVSADSQPSASFQWRKDGISIVDATGASLAFSSLTLADAGDYDVLVTNALGSVISATATITVSAPPTISAQPISETVNVGEPTTLSVTASGLPSPSYQWRRNGSNIAGATSATLDLGLATLADAGDYDVVISNSLDTIVSATATLTVQQPPQINTQPVSAAVLRNSPVELSVSAFGTPTPTYQWRKDGVDISGATGTTLNLGNVDLDDDGDYDVVITNAAGTTTSTLATVTVQVLPEITAHPVPQTTVLAGADVTLTVAATGTPTPTYQWRKDGIDITGATAAELTLSAVTLADAGTYSVVVTNAAGSVTSDNAVLSVVELSGTQSTDGYAAGETITITNIVTFAGPVDSLTWSVIPPAAIEGSPWSFVSTTGDVGSVVPQAGDEDLFEWTWSTLPVSPFSFSYELNVPAAAIGGYDLSAMVSVVANGTTLQGLVAPEPLTLAEPVTSHSADYNQDGAIDLSELLRVIELYNTRNGTTRTGAYQLDGSTEDGFAPDASRAADAPASLTRYHSADYDQDSYVNLSELLRVIELYNYRSGTTRTGEYHLNASTEDGFAPGPEPTE
ncbi:immunoglobulin domain-containing protein [Actomonas aquatica]|uniref:Immunoglobulin domain-containing protein n=1 Tax=Actomonas aquatica TaxID=2866162 RepID=A0ABZ1CEP8_9BACT|nr:immunoglobulin domain-containing protein [Opitutus sp. WL0086]WRQ90019.1 immunoglobulin domain-containing protein [Opitutus sp. WL0086]